MNKNFYASLTMHSTLLHPPTTSSSIQITCHYGVMVLINLANSHRRDLNAMITISNDQPTPQMEIECWWCSLMYVGRLRSTPLELLLFCYNQGNPLAHLLHIPHLPINFHIKVCIITCPLDIIHILCTTVFP